MPRRNRKSPAEGFIDLASRLPWWLCLVLAALSYFVLHAFASSPPPIIRSSTDVGSSFIPIALRGMAAAGQYILPLLFLVGAVLSGLRRFRGQNPVSRVSTSTHSKQHSTNGRAEVNTLPTCPKCNAPMVQRRARRGDHVGQTFWGCTQYPGCKGTRPGA